MEDRRGRCRRINPQSQGSGVAAAEAADHRADLVVVNVWENTIPPPTGSVSVSERYVPYSSQRTPEDFSTRS